MKYRNLEIIGTSHIARQSLEEVEKAITEGRPDIVALELDNRRLHALMSGEKGKASLKDMGRIGVKGYLFALFGAWAEKKLGKMVGVAPGSEMKHAAMLARNNKIRIALIDQDIEITLRRFSKALTWKEKWNFVADIFKAMFSKKGKVEFDLTKVPEKAVIRKLIGKVKKRYPNIYRVLIEERNEAMAAKLKRLMSDNEDKKILAVVGAGHEEEIISILKKPEISYSIKIG